MDKIRGKVKKIYLRITKLLNKLFLKSSSTIKIPINRLKTFHQRIIQVRIDEEVDRNPYQLFLEWLLEVIVFGALSAIVFTAFVRWDGWLRAILYIFAFGIAKWLILLLIKEIKDIIRET